MSDNGALSERDAIFYAAAIAKGLEHLHSSGLVYRNLCPHGIALGADGYPLLVDLSHAARVNESLREKIRDWSGPGIAYMPPEQVNGHGHARPSDYWGLGLLIYEMVTESIPWLTGHEREDQSELHVCAKIAAHRRGGLEMPESFSRELCSLVEALLEPRPQKRLGSVPEALYSHAWFNGQARRVSWWLSGGAGFGLARYMSSKQTHTNARPFH